MRRLVLWLLTKRRSFRFGILFLFLSLFAIAFTSVLAFIYTKNYNTVLDLSRYAAHTTINLIHSRFENIALTAERITQLSTGVLPTIGPLSSTNPILHSYLLNQLKNSPDFSSVYVGLPNGDYIQALEISYFSDKNFVKDPSKPLPKDAAFIWRIVNRQVDPTTDTWQYLNNDFELITQETLSPTSFTAVTRPWYQGAQSTRKSYWTGYYTFVPTQQKGVSIGSPLINKEGALQAVIGADLSFSLLSDFLDQQKIGKSGKAFILNAKGKIIVPHPDTSTIITPQLVNSAHEWFYSNPDRTDFLLEKEGISYLCVRANLTNIFGTDWMILVIAPLDDFLGELIQTQQQIRIFIFFIVLLSIFIINLFAKRISKPITTLADELNKIKALDLDSHVRVKSNIEEIFLLDQAMAAMRYVMNCFSKYVPKELVKQLLEMQKEISLGGEKREITVFFSDIASFTTIAESQPIDVLLPLVTEYFEAMSSVIRDLGGTIDKFLGDGIMAFWGAPIESEDHTEKACEAALKCHVMLRSFNKERKKQGKPEFPTRFGVHSGEVIVGNIGTHNRMNYTVIGDVVNTTARLQEVDKVYHTSIIVSEQVHCKLPSSYITRPLDLVAVKGKTKRTRLYELVGKLDAEPELCPPPEKIELCQLFSQAYECMQKEDRSQAFVLFTQIAERFPDDHPTQIYLERLKEPS